jgi:capsular polysaccharide biosynthesis protein
MNEKNAIYGSEFLYVLLKRKKIIIVITLAVTIITGIVSFFVLPPVYEAKASVIIGKKDNSVMQPGEVVTYQNLTSTYISVITSQYIEQKASDEIGNGMTYMKLKNSITATAELGTQIIDITAQANNPQEALKEVTAVSDVLVKHTSDVFNAGSIKIIENGQLPTKPVSPNKHKNVIMSFFIGLMFSIGLAIFLEYLDSTFKSAKDIKLGL